MSDHHDGTDHEHEDATPQDDAATGGYGDPGEAEALSGGEAEEQGASENEPSDGAPPQDPHGS